MIKVSEMTHYVLISYRYVDPSSLKNWTSYYYLKSLRHLYVPLFTGGIEVIRDCLLIVKGVIKYIHLLAST